MPSINDWIGSQNVIRVLSNAAAAPTRLVNMTDVDSSRSSEEGLVLVWDSASEKFVLTDKLDASTIIQTGITSISNDTNSSTATTGALTVEGGVGISKNLTLGAGFVAAGVATFTSDIDANASVDIFRDLRVSNNLNVTGVSTFVGVSTFSGDLYVGGDLYLKDDLVLDNITGSSLKITGISTVGILSATTVTATSVIATNVNTSGITTLAANGGITTTGGDLYVGGSLYSSSALNFSNLGVTQQLTVGKLNVTGVTTFQNNVSLLENDILRFGGALGGTGSLHIYHNGSDSYIDDVALGNLILRSTKFFAKSPSDEIMISASPNADVKLFFNNINRVETTDYGAKVTGILSATSITAGELAIELIDGGSY